jgi:hypothetical protein
MKEDTMSAQLLGGAVFASLSAGAAAFLAALLGVGTSLPGAKPATFPGVAIAAPSRGIDVAQLELDAPKDLLLFDELHQRHTGVLDVLITPWRPPYLVARMERDPELDRFSGTGAAIRRAEAATRIRAQ